MRRTEHHREGLFWPVIHNTGRRACVARPRASRRQVLQNRRVGAAVRREILSARAGPVAGGHHAVPFVFAGENIV